MIYIICVTYGNHNSCLKAINRLADKIKAYIVLVDTKHKVITTPRGIYKDNRVNNYFEFSGYQAGLNILISERVISLNRNKIFIINDTVFTSHLYQLYKYVFKACLKIDGDNKVSGLTENRFFGEIIPSCFFCFLVSEENAKKINFISEFSLENNSNDINLSSLYLVNKAAFQKEIDSWLNPKVFWKGWYKSVPLVNLPEHVYSRKYLAIYLEYCFLQNNNTLEVCALNKETKTIRVLKFADRLYCNFIKLKYRIFEFTK